MIIRAQKYSVDLTGALLFGFLFVLLAMAVQLLAQSPGQGYTDTEFLPDGKWRVHDANRPHPPQVTPGGQGSAPSDAIVLFDGKDLSRWVGRNGQPAAWKVENGHMQIVPGTGEISTRARFGDCQLHIEWLVPADVKGTGQDRGNSGVMLMGKFEIQVLESKNNVTYADGQAGAMYGQYPPLVNASRPAGEWQTYDIIFEAPRFEGSKVAKPAYVTVLHNGIVLHHRQAFIGQTAHRKLAQYASMGSEGPLVLQDHRHPVKFRNIWVRPLKGYDTP